MSLLPLVRRVSTHSISREARPSLQGPRLLGRICAGWRSVDERRAAIGRCGPGAGVCPGPSRSGRGCRRSRRCGPCSRSRTGRHPWPPCGRLCHTVRSGAVCPAGDRLYRPPAVCPPTRSGCRTGDSSAAGQPAVRQRRVAPEASSPAAWALGLTGKLIERPDAHPVDTPTEAAA
jgi:hypothetical protein